MNTNRTNRTRRWPWIAGGGVAVIVAASVASNAAGSHPSVTLTPSSASSSSPPSSSPSPAQRYVNTQRISWAFKVTGDAPAGADITYGNDSDNLGATTVPFRATLPGKAGALYWDLTAQLQGGGDITARVYEIKTTHWSDGTTTRTRHVVATAHASGGYNIANAEYVGLDAGTAHVGG